MRGGRGEGKPSPKRLLTGVRDFGCKTSRPFGNTGKVPFKWPSEGPAWGTCFLQAVVEKEARVRVFDVIFTRPLPEGPERCPVEGG